MVPVSVSLVCEVPGPRFRADSSLVREATSETAPIGRLARAGPAFVRLSVVQEPRAVSLERGRAEPKPSGMLFSWQ